MQRGSRKWYSSALFLNVTAKSLIINGGHQMLFKNISISTMIDWLLERETFFYRSSAKLDQCFLCDAIPSGVIPLTNSSINLFKELTPELK
jgi:hypothetical protein